MVPWWFVAKMSAVIKSYWATLAADRRFSLYLGSKLLHSVIQAPFNPFLPIFVAESLGRPQAFAAALRAAETLSQTLASLVFGLLSTNSRAKLALALATLHTPVAAAMFLSRDPSLLMVLASLHGVLSGVSSSVSSLYLVTMAPPARIGAASSLQYVGSTLGSAIGAAM